MAGEEAMPEEAPTEAAPETIVVQIVCQHAPDGARTYLVGRPGEGDEGADDMKPVATLDEALRSAKMLLQGGDEAADAQAEQEFAQGFRGGNAPAY